MPLTGGAERAPEAVEHLERGRSAYATRAWSAAYESLSRADQSSPLGADDLELLATAAYMLGRDDDYRQFLERAHHVHLEEGESRRAVRSAFWVGIHFMLRGELGPALGWFGRAERLLEREGDCVERGYLLIPVLLRHVASGDSAAAYEAAGEAARIGARFGDKDLVALVLQEQGHALIRRGQSEEGLRLLDETMVAVTAGELSPIVTGLVYCNTIAFCQGVYELRRAREWTAALTLWCERQPDMVAHTGVCLVHRAEILELQGTWPDALDEARRAAERFAAQPSGSRSAVGSAVYRQGEVHRLRGELVAAEDAYREASGHGWEPQPGLALLRLAQGKGAVAAAAIARVLSETTERLARARVLPAYVEIMLAIGDVDEARTAQGELDEIAVAQGSEMLTAISARARGELALAEGDARTALVALRDAARRWQELGAPYEAARARVLVGLACRALGDEDTAAMELEAAGDVFERLGAAPARARVDSIVQGSVSADPYGLTRRELEVLRLVASGETNKAIAAELVLSERTVDRHVSNILKKLRVPTRAGATAFAYERRLVG